MPLPRNDCNAMLDPRALRVAPGDHLDAGVFRPHLEAANMRASQHRDRETAADGRDVFRRIFEPQIQFSAGECFLNASKWHGQVAEAPSPRTSGTVHRAVRYAEDTWAESNSGTTTL